MDADQFDGMVKTLGSGTDRRRVLSVVAGGLVAALGGRQVTQAAHKSKHCAKAGQKPHGHKPCCFGTAVNGRCPAETAPVTGRCITDESVFPEVCQCRNAAGAVCAPLGTCQSLLAGVCREEGDPCVCVA